MHNWLLFSYRNNLPKNMGKTTGQECKKFTFGLRASLKQQSASRQHSKEGAPTAIYYVSSICSRVIDNLKINQMGL